MARYSESDTTAIYDIAKDVELQCLRAACCTQEEARVRTARFQSILRYHGKFPSGRQRRSGSCRPDCG